MSATSLRVAAIDCGTNAIRLLIADVHTDGHRPRLVDVHREERLVRLGEGVDATGLLAPQAIDRAWQALADYAAVIRATGVLELRIAATSATRDARNANEFTAMVRATIGRDPEVLSGAAEAEIGFLGTVGDLNPDDGPALVIDIGGGSTELIVGLPFRGDDGRLGDGTRSSQDAGIIRGAVSLDLGAVRITERILRDDPPSRQQISDAQRWASGLIAPALDRLPLRGVRQVVAVAGTALTVAAAALRHVDLNPQALQLASVPIAEIDRAATFLLGATRAHRAALRYVQPGRTDVIGGGALILRTIADLLAARIGIEQITVSGHDILDGLALSLASRLT
jgi:exopolyphosphatase/guanosine-5'-triphosphate,3'-diphosphate pyrophosphatase